MKRIPLGDHPYKVAISRDELRVAVEWRKQTGEGINTLVRRLLREHSKEVYECK